ncbi:hypothetical protein CEXT_779231 [Caerostris extrusa]|uniref:Uncharacterized protein n=1 Tax=Caerostris extrusa TaxID=172846 RepID=A0AAV4X1Y6_CAEEX|nr:hypothetical protein CEXT_779231 [Caerostris extrusa]
MLMTEEVIVETVDLKEFTCLRNCLLAHKLYKIRIVSSFVLKRDEEPSPDIVDCCSRFDITQDASRGTFIRGARRELCLLGSLSGAADLRFVFSKIQNITTDDPAIINLNQI